MAKQAVLISSRKPGFHFTSAWFRTFCRRGIRSTRDSSLCSQGMELRSSDLRKSMIGARISFSPAPRALSSAAITCLFDAAFPAPLHITSKGASTAKIAKKIRITMSGMVFLRLVHFGYVFENRGRQGDAGDLQAVDKTRPDARGSEGADHLASGPDALLFHAGHFGHARHLAGAVAQARDLDDNVERGGNLLAHRAFGEVEAAHGDHGFETGERVARRVGVDGGHGAFVAGVH